MANIAALLTSARNDGDEENSKDEWGSPQWIFDLLHQEFNFTIDAAATAENTKLPVFWTKETDALKQEWGGKHIIDAERYGVTSLCQVECGVPTAGSTSQRQPNTSHLDQPSPMDLLLGAESVCDQRKRVESELQSSLHLPSGEMNRLLQVLESVPAANESTLLLKYIFLLTLALEQDLAPGAESVVAKNLGLSCKGDALTLWREIEFLKPRLDMLNLKKGEKAKEDPPESTTNGENNETAISLGTGQTLSGDGVKNGGGDDARTAERRSGSVRITSSLLQTPTAQVLSPQTSSLRAGSATPPRGTDRLSSGVTTSPSSRGSWSISQGLLKIEYPQSIWINPPYSIAGKFTEKAYRSAASGQATCVLLVAARPDTGYWWGYSRQAEVRFLPGRLRFIGGKSGATFPSAILVFHKGMNRSPTTVYWDVHDPNKRRRKKREE